MNHPRGRGSGSGGVNKSLSLTPFSNFSHHNKICREAPPLPFSQTQSEPSQMPLSCDILVLSCARRRFPSDAGVAATRLKNSRFDRIPT